MTNKAYQRVVVIGDGGWGTTLAMLLHKNGIKVALWSAFPEHVEELKRHRVVDEAVHERVNGGIRLARLSLAACKTRHAGLAKGGDGGGDGPLQEGSSVHRCRNSSINGNADR